MNGFGKWIVGIATALTIAAILGGVNVYATQGVIRRDVETVATGVVENSARIRELEKAQIEAFKAQTRAQQETKELVGKILEKLEK